MPKTFAVARPYTTHFKERVSGYLGDLGYELKTGGVLPAGTPDEVAAHWTSRQEVDLLVLPFHLHRSPEGIALDGVGIALLLPPRFDTEMSPILMPVSKYSWEASYERRMSALREARPLLAQRILPMQEHEVGSARITKVLGARRGAGAAAQSPISAPSLRGFPSTSAMSGSFEAVTAQPSRGSSESTTDESSEKGRDNRTTSSWKTTQDDDTPSASWRTSNEPEPPASDVPGSGERMKSAISDPGLSFQQAYFAAKARAKAPKK